MAWIQGVQVEWGGALLTGYRLLKTRSWMLHGLTSHPLTPLASPRISTLCNNPGLVMWRWLLLLCTVSLSLSLSPEGGLTNQLPNSLQSITWQTLPHPIWSTDRHCIVNYNDWHAVKNNNYIKQLCTILISPANNAFDSKVRFGYFHCFKSNYVR